MTAKQLFDGPRNHVPWSEKEVKALVEFILFHSPGDKWPTTKNDHFWRNAALFVKERSSANMLRTSKMLYMYMYIVYTFTVVVYCKYNTCTHSINSLFPL